MTYIAILHDTNQVIAESDSFSDCDNKAIEACGWGLMPGSCAPYFITTDSWIKDEN